MASVLSRQDQRACGLCGLCGLYESYMNSIIQNNVDKFFGIPFNPDRSWMSNIGLSILHVKQGHIDQYHAYSMDNVMNKTEKQWDITPEDLIWHDQINQLNIYNNKIRYIGKKANGYIVGSGYKPKQALGHVVDVYKDDINKIIIAKIQIENTNKSYLIYDFYIVDEQHEQYEQ